MPRSRPFSGPQGDLDVAVQLPWLPALRRPCAIRGGSVSRSRVPEMWNGNCRQRDDWHQGWRWCGGSTYFQYPHVERTAGAICPHLERTAGANCWKTRGEKDASWRGLQQDKLTGWKGWDEHFDTHGEVKGVFPCFHPLPKPPAPTRPALACAKIENIQR